MYTIFRYGNVLVLVFSQWIVRQSMACILPAYRPQQAILLQQCPVTVRRCKNILRGAELFVSVYG